VPFPCSAGRRREWGGGSEGKIGWGNNVTAASLGPKNLDFFGRNLGQRGTWIIETTYLHPRWAEMPGSGRDGTWANIEGC